MLEIKNALNKTVSEKSLLGSFLIIVFYLIVNYESIDAKVFWILIITIAGLVIASFIGTNTSVWIQMLGILVDKNLTTDQKMKEIEYLLIKLVSNWSDLNDALKKTEPEPAKT